jgi:nickel/cobalt transporter (NicO) family protein
MFISRNKAFCTVSHFVFIKQFLSNIRLLPGAKQPKTSCNHRHHKSLNKISLFILFILILQFLGSFALFADPFTGGSGVRPQASRPSSVLLPDGFNKFQLEIREKSADFLDDFRSNPSAVSVILFLMVVFFYGILHGAGPGHRKTVVFTLFLSRSARKWEPLAAGFLSAGLHAGTSLLLFVFFNLIWRSVSSFSDSENISFYLEGWTFIILAAFALALVFFKIFSMLTGPGHNYSGKDGKSLYYLLIISSLFPCPGATMLLILALSQNMIAMGVFGVLAMSLGMGIIISLAGYLGMAGRERVFQWFKNREHLVGRINIFFELLSYSFVAVFSLWMGSPFIFWLFQSI